MITSQADTREVERGDSSCNYGHFGPEYYDFSSFDGPEPGGEAPDFEATTPEGRRVCLWEFRGQWVVLETGSITCPITDSKVHAMDELRCEHEDVEFVRLYTREAHPGEPYEAHDTFAEKLDRARTFVGEYGVERTVLVDDTVGTGHRQYDGMPNSVHVVNPDEVVVMRGDWNDPRTVKRVLARRDPNRTYEREIYRSRPLFSTPKKGTLRVLRDAGPRTVRDFVIKVPALALMDLKKEFRGMNWNSLEEPCTDVGTTIEARATIDVSSNPAPTDDSPTFMPGPFAVVSMYIADQTWPELGDYVAEESVAIVPLGSTEQHGPHLPLATDHLIAEALAREAGERTGFLCTPTVNVGVSPHHRQFHGTMWVDPPEFRDYVESFTRNLTYHGVDRVVYVNAHGGNVQHLREVGRRLHEDETAYAIEWMWDESIPDLIDDLSEFNGPHGGPKETAMIQHIAPELVRGDQLSDARDGGVKDMTTIRDDNFVHGARTFYDARENSDNGVFGDQTDATAEKGAELFEAATGQLVKLLEWLDAQTFEELMPESHVDPQPGSHR